MIICRGGISFITEPTSRELVTREICVNLFLRHVGTMHEQRIIPNIAEGVSQYVSGLQTLCWHIIERVDSRPRGDSWQGQERSTYPKSITSIKYPSFGCIQGVSIWHVASSDQRYYTVAGIGQIGMHQISPRYIEPIY